MPVLLTAREARQALAARAEQVVREVQLVPAVQGERVVLAAWAGDLEGSVRTIVIHDERC